MPPFLTISDDLQLVIDEKGSFLSKRNCSRDKAVADVFNWLDANPAHVRRGEAEQWLMSAQDRASTLIASLSQEAKRERFNQLVDEMFIPFRNQLWREGRTKFHHLNGKATELARQYACDKLGFDISEP